MHTKIEKVYLGKEKYPYSWMMNVEIHDPLEVVMNGETYKAGSIESIFQGAKILATAKDALKEMHEIQGTSEAEQQEKHKLQAKHDELFKLFEKLIVMPSQLVNPEDVNSLGDNIIDAINAAPYDCRRHKLWMHNFADVMDINVNELTSTFGSDEIYGNEGRPTVYWKLEFMKYLLDLRIRQQPERLVQLLDNGDTYYEEDVKDKFWGAPYNGFAEAWKSVVNELRHELATTKQIKVRTSFPPEINNKLGLTSSPEFSSKVYTQADLDAIRARSANEGKNPTKASEAGIFAYKEDGSQNKGNPPIKNDMSF